MGVATFVVFGWSVAALAARFAWVSPPSAGHSIVVHKLVSTRAGYWIGEVLSQVNSYLGNIFTCQII